MGTAKRIMDAIFTAVDEINQTLPPANHIPKSEDTALMGPESAIDSLGVVLLIVAIEQKVSQALGRTVVLTNNMLMSAEENPFKTLGALRDHILGSIGKNSGE